jgi:enoyl-CoA hydratase
MGSLVRYEVRERIAHVTLDNGKANALSPDVVAELEEAITQAEAAGPGDVGALLITGRPGLLSGGFDLEVMRRSPADAGALVHAGGSLIARLYGSPVPVVVACGGHAIAAGALLLLSADERFGAAGSFRIGLTETQIGMVLPRWASELAEERLSRRHLQLATVGARTYDPAGARDAGFLDEVVDPADLEATALAAAQRWAELPRGAYAGQVKLLRGERLRRITESLAVDASRAFAPPA